MSRSSLLSFCALAALLAACSGQQSAYTPASPMSDAPGAAAAQAPAQSTIDTSAAADPAQSQAATTSIADASSVSPMATTAIPKHIATWAKDLYWSAGARGTATEVRDYVTFAQGGLGNAKASADCSGSNGCSSVFYFNPNFFYNRTACGAVGADETGILKHGNETWYVHLKGYGDSAHRVRGSYALTCNGKSVTIPVYAMNSLSTSMQSYYRTYFHTNASAFNYFMMDDTSAHVMTQFYGPGGGFCWNTSNHVCIGTQEMPTDASVIAEHVALGKALTHPNGTAMQGFFNGLNFTGSTVNGLNIMSAAGSPYIGAWCEDCVVNSGVFRPTLYANVLNAMAQINRIPNARFVELNHGESPLGSAAQIAQRTITTAIAWLGYSEGHTVVYPDLEATTQNLAVFPENSIYPTRALQTMTTGATNLEVAPGIYRREFSACYNAGVAIGPCASIVNATGSTVVLRSTWLRQAYGHVVALTGGDIPAGGKMYLTSSRFVANSTTLARGQGILIVR